MDYSSQLAKLDKMTEPSRMLDQWVAEYLMSWQWIKGNHSSYCHCNAASFLLPKDMTLNTLSDNDCYPYAITSNGYMRRKGSKRKSIYNKMPMYSNKVDYMGDIEDTIENLGIGNRYADELIAMIDPKTSIFDSAIECGNHTGGLDAYSVVLRVLRATPYERCIAALRAYFKSDGGNKVYEGW